MASYLTLAREKAEKRNHSILYSWTVGSESWITAVRPVVRERTRWEFRNVSLLLTLFLFITGFSIAISSRELALLVLVGFIISSLITWIIYLRCRTDIMYPPKRTFFLTQAGFFNGYEYITRVRSFDIDVREKRIYLQTEIYVPGNYPGTKRWKELEMLLIWEQEEDGSEIMAKVKHLVLQNR